MTFTNSNENTFNFQIINDSNEIIKYLFIGTNIPIWQEFYKYILHDLNYFKAKSINLKKNGNPIGHVLVFSDGSDVLYFGYFGLLGHFREHILFLVDKLIEFAEKNNFKLIRGPINIPAIIYGWGFMKEGSDTSLFIGKPVNPPIYQELFIEKGFYVKTEEISWEGGILWFNPWKIKKYNFNEYEYFNPKNLREFSKFKGDYLRIHSQNLPPNAQLTPKINFLMDNYAEFIFDFGHSFMLIFVRHKPSDKIVACGTCIPNPFRKDDKGNYDSCIAFTWAIEPEYRKKGLSMLMFGETSRRAWKMKMRYISAPVERENLTNKIVENKLFLENKRTHIILEKKL